MNIVPKDKASFTLQTFLDIKLHKSISTSEFEEAIRFISNTQTMDSIRMFLTYLQTNTDIDIMITVREFLSIYMICYFHNDVLSTQKNETETLLYELCKELVAYIETYTHEQTEPFNIRVYTKKLNTYSILFHIWKKKDIQSQKDIYMSLYVDYAEEIGTFIQKAKDIHRFDEYEQYINKLMSMKDKIKDCLLSLIGQEEFEQLVQSKLNPIGLFNKESKEVIQNYLIEAYWNIFKHNIDDTNKITDDTIITKLGMIIKEYFNIIYLNNQDTLDKVYHKIDFIIDKIICTNNASDYLIDLIYLLYNELIFLHPTHRLLNHIERKLENVETLPEIIYILKLLMKEFSIYKQ